MHPLGYLSGSGAQTASVVPLMWVMLIVSIVVSLVVIGLVVWAVITKRAPVGPRSLRSIALEHRDGVKWIWTGLAISIVPLLATVFWTVAVLANTGAVPTGPLTIDILAKRWWWDAQYRDGATGEQFRVANEIHIPVGRPVLLRLRSADVIHSFWVPKLAGKTDVIPGQVNAMWIQADAAGRYRGQCGEFCGAQHAHMAFYVVADPPLQFAQWERQQMQPAFAPATAQEGAGLSYFTEHCGRCHSVRGTAAQGTFGPDLTHLMSRQTIGAGMLQNNPASLSGWVENAQTVKPGALMPNQQISGPDLTVLRSYLETLR